MWFRVARCCFWGSWPGTDLETNEVTGIHIEKIKLSWEMQTVCYLFCENTNAKCKPWGKRTNGMYCLLIKTDDVNRILMRIR